MLRYYKERKMRLSRRVSGSRGRGARPATHSPRQAPRTANPHAAGASKTLGEIPNPVASGGPTNKNPRPAPRRGAELPTSSCAGRGGAGEGPGGGVGRGLPCRRRSCQPSDNALRLLGDLGAIQSSLAQPVSTLLAGLGPSCALQPE